MKDIKISSAAAAALADILEFSMERWGLVRAEEYKQELLERVRSAARGEPPHPRPCEILMQGKRNAAGLCYCAAGRHFIILRETATSIEVVEFFHQSRDLERLINRLTADEVKSRDDE